MSIAEYFIYGFLLAVAGGGGIALSITSDAGNDAAGPLMLIGVVLATIGTVFGSIGTVAKGVQVGQR